MPQFAANLTTLFTELQMIDRFAAAAEAGFTVLSLDRPGFGASALYPEEFADPARRVVMAHRAVEASEHVGTVLLLPAD